MDHKPVATVSAADGYHEEEFAGRAMPQSPQPKSYLPQQPSTTPSRGEPRFLDKVANACRLKHLSYRTPIVARVGPPAGHAADPITVILLALGIAAGYAVSLYLRPLLFGRPRGR